MTNYNEVLKDFQNFITGKTAEEKKIILDLIDEWTGNLILGGINGGKAKENDTRI